MELSALVTRYGGTFEDLFATFEPIQNRFLHNVPLLNYSLFTHFQRDPCNSWGVINRRLTVYKTGGD